MPSMTLCPVFLIFGTYEICYASQRITIKSVVSINDISNKITIKRNISWYVNQAADYENFTNLKCALIKNKELAR